MCCLMVLMYYVGRYCDDVCGLCLYRQDVPLNGKLFLECIKVFFFFSCRSKALVESEEVLFVRSCLVDAGADFDVCFIVVRSIIRCFGYDDSVVHIKRSRK